MAKTPQVPALDGITPLGLPKPRFSPGDRVKYRVQFLRNVGAYTGWMPFAKGTVYEVSASGIVTVLWEEGPYGAKAPREPFKVLDKNITLASDPETASY